MQYLDFEKELENLDIQIDTLKNPFENDGLSSLKNEEIQNIESEIDKKINEIYLNLDGWQKTKVARHASRPRSEFYIPLVVNNLITRELAAVQLLPTKEQWYGVTYKEDKPIVQKALMELTAANKYPLGLWEAD